MGWGRYLLLGNLGQQMDIADQREQMDRMRGILRSRARRGASRKDVERLEGEVDELRLYLAALVRLVVARGVITEEELRALVAAVDAEDGAADGRHGGKVC